MFRSGTDSDGILLGQYPNAYPNGERFAAIP
jgi:hypothetical protein